MEPILPKKSHCVNIYLTLLRPPRPQELRQRLKIEKPKTGKPTRPAEAISISWTGEIARDQWNLFALRVLSRLAQAEQLNITVSINGKLKPEHDVNALNDALSKAPV